MSLDLVVVYGSVRSARQGIKLARFLVRQLQARGHTAHLIDPLEVRLPLLDRMYKEYPQGEAPAVLEDMARRLRAADGFLIVSGEYNHGIPPALKNLLDHFLEEWFWRPSAIACYSAGAFGGVRAAISCAQPSPNSACRRFRRSLRCPRSATFGDDGTPLDDRPTPGRPLLAESESVRATR